MMRAGIVILMFVAYQLWGTGLATSRAQASLTKEFDAQIEALTPTIPNPESAPVETAPVNLPIPEPGDPIARLTIGAIDSDFIVVQGVDLKLRQDGPGHFAQTPLPGQPGNAAIAGHRTTYKAPFNRIDELVPGDLITVTTLQGTFTYAVDEQLDPKTLSPSGHQIVSSNNLSILDQSFGNRLTLMACHPKFSAAQRIVVTATLTSTPAPTTPIPDSVGVTTDASADALAGGDSSAWPAAILSSLLTVLVWFGTWWLARFWRRAPRGARFQRVPRWKDWTFLTTYVVGTPLVLISMFFAFTCIARLLPSSF